MKIGPSFALLVVGAILTFAVTADLSFVNIHVVGVILMMAGIVAVTYHVRRENTPRRTDVYCEPGHTAYVEPSELRDPVCD
jgi:hypothetical protein